MVGFRGSNAFQAMPAYRVYFDQSPNPSIVPADSLVDAFRIARDTLAELQAEGTLKGFTIKTVVEQQP